MTMRFAALGRLQTISANKGLASAWARGLWWLLPIHRRPQIGLAICAVFKNEAHYLAEWVVFHHLMGVERFYLYDNGSTDDWRSVLHPELEAGTVKVTDWSAPVGDMQLSAYRHCIEAHRRTTRWIAFIDVDEFLFAPDGRKLPDALAAFKQAPGVIAGWRVYGTSGWRTTPSGLVTNNYLMRAVDNHFLNTYGKPIVDPRRTVSLVTNPHIFRHYDGTRFWRGGVSVDASGEPFFGASLDASGAPIFDSCASAETLRINHYYVRSEAAAVEKSRRGPVFATQPPVEQYLDPQLNAVRDEVILGLAPELTQRLRDRSPASP